MVVTPCLHFVASVCSVRVHQLASTWCCHSCYKDRLKACRLVVVVTPWLQSSASVCGPRVNQLASTWHSQAWRYQKRWYNHVVVPAHKSDGASQVLLKACNTGFWQRPRGQHQLLQLAKARAGVPPGLQACPWQHGWCKLVLGIKSEAREQTHQHLRFPGDHSAEY